jgi:adenosylcobinamide-GDP ribazoletransferase
VKTAALAAVGSGPDALLAVAAAFALGRSAPVALARLPYARPAGGSGSALTEAPGWTRPVALLLGLALALGLLGVRGLALAGGALVAAALVGLVARRRLGGVTGDVLGAAAELATTAALVAAAATR